MKNVIIVLLALIVVILVITLLPIMGNDSSLLRRCKFNERSGRYDVCYWIWDERLGQPSIYF